MISLLQQDNPNLEVESIGAPETVVEQVKVSRYPGLWQVCKIVFVCCICFFGAAFTIMAFHNDIGIREVFGQIYELLTGQEPQSVTALEIAYSIGLTTAGYVGCVVLMVALVVIASVLSAQKSKGTGMDARKLAFCAMGMALAFVTSYVKVFELPYGGSVTLFSMLFIVLIANWYGAKTGILVGFAYGLLQFIQGPYVLSLFQVCCDYVFAFAALGVAGFFGKKKNGLLIGYIVAVLARGFFHTLGGYLYWMDYMPENFPQSLKALYPIIYNYSYLLAEGVLTVILISLPPVKKALQMVARTAHGAN